jgi:hypothetical protein
MKTTFDLPEPLLREAKSLAAQQGRPLRDLVAEALTEKLTANAASQSIPRRRATEWTAFEATLLRLPDGSYLNPHGIQDEGYFADVEAAREHGSSWPRRDPFADVR